MVHEERAECRRRNRRSSGLLVLSVSSLDPDCDGRADLITGAGRGGGPHVKVFDGRSGEEVRNFFAYYPSFTGGLNLAAGGGWIVSGAGPVGGPHVKAFNGRTLGLVRSFFPFEPAYLGGVFVG